MAWSGGVFSRVRNWVTDKANAVNPQAALFDQEDDNFAGGLNNCVTKDGLNKPSATMDWNNQRLTNLGAATARTDALQAAQYQDGGSSTLGAVAGTDTITGTLAPAITAYVSGMRITFRPANTNTGAVSINVNGVGAKSIVKYVPAAVALVAGDLTAGATAVIIYDGTNFVLTNPAKISVTDTDAGISLTSTNTASNTEAYIAGFIKDSASSNRKVGALAFQYGNNDTTVGYGTWNVHTTKLIAGVPADVVGLLVGANNGATFFPVGTAAADLPQVDGTVRIFAPAGKGQLNFRNPGGNRVSYGLSGAIEGDTSIDAVVYSESGIRFYANGSVTPIVTVAGTGAIATAGARSDEFGYAGIPQNSQAVDYTCVLTDRNKEIYQTGASKTVTIPANASVAFPIGTILTGTFTNATGGSVAITSDTMTMAGTTSTGTRTVSQNGIWTARKETATSWLIMGPGVG